MEPFFIACTTCQVQLKVRDPQAVGQILTCPKCGSMVLVSPPSAIEVDDTAVDEQPQELEGGKRRRSPATEPSQIEDARESDTTEDLSLYGTQSNSLLEDNANSGGALSGGVLENDTLSSDMQGPQPPPLALPPDDWAANKNQAWRGWLQRIIAICFGILLAIGLFGFIAVRLRGRPSSEGATNPAQQTATPLSPAQPIPEPVEPASIPPKTTADALTAETTESSPQSAVMHSQVPSPAASSLPATTIDPEPSTPGPPAVVSDATSDAPPGLISDPPPEAPRAGISSRNTVSEMLRQVDELLADTSPEPAVAEVTAEPATATGEAEEDALPRPPRLTTDVPGRLNDVIAEFACDEIALVEFLRFMMDFSTIPTTIHAASLDWQRVSLEAPITVHEVDQTVAALLETALSPLGLEYAIVGEQLMIRRSGGAEPGKLREVAFDLEDLALGDAEALSDLALAVTTMIRPTSWNRPGGGTVVTAGNRLVVTQTEAILFEVLFFFEKLRLARGLKTRGHFEPHLFDPLRRARQEQAFLTKKVTLTFLQETPFHEIVERLEKSAGGRILIDWQSLGAEGWNPLAKLTYQTHDRPLREALTELLEPMGLDYRFLDDGLLEVTTKRTLAEQLMVECYPATKWLATRDDGDTAIFELEQMLGVDHFQRAGGPNLLLKDSRSDVLILLANRASHRRLVAKLFADQLAATNLE